MAEGEPDLREFDPSLRKVRSRPAVVSVASEEQLVASDLPTPSTENVVANAWLEDDKTNGNERDYECVLLVRGRVPGS